MKNNNEIRNNSLKIVINILTSIIFGYGLYRCFKININNFKNVSFATKLGLLLIVFILIGHISVLIHEAGHAVALTKLGIKIKIFKVGPIKYVSNGNNKRIVFDKSGLLLIGGYVMPEASKHIYDQSSFDKFTRHYIKFLFSGIIVTIVTMIVAAILIFLNKAIVINLLVIAVNWPILIKSFDNENLSFGDFYLIKLLKDKPNYICAMLQNNIMTEYPMNSFLEKKIEKFLNEQIIKEDYSELILGVADKILDEYIIQQKQLCSELEKLKKWVFNRYNQMDNDYISIVTIIKLSHKFLLHEYSLRMKSLFIDHYNIVNEYVLKNHNLLKHIIIERIMGTLQILSIDGNLLDVKFPYIISDLEFKISECDNCRKKIRMIVDRLN